MNIFQELKNISKSGIYLLESSNKDIFIGYSSNILLALTRNIYSDYSNMTILEIVTSKELLRPRCQYYKDHYSNNGFKLLNPNRVCNIRVKIDLLEDFRDKGSGKYLFYVSLVSKGYWKRTVGVFDTVSAAEAFSARKYSNNRVYDIVYSSNDLTKEYLVGNR